MFHGKRLNPAVVDLVIVALVTVGWGPVTQATATPQPLVFQKLIPDLVIVALATVGWGPVSQATATPQPLVFQKLPVSDVLFGEDVLGQKPARSRVDCGRMCARDARCLVFTFQPGAQGTPGSCRSHSTRCAAQGQQGAAPGARSYSLRKGAWIQKLCSFTSDCREPMAACFSGQCLCDGGFFFDHTENACVSTCTRGLGDQYLVYRDRDISGHDIKSFYGTDNMTACKSTCSALPHCLTLVDWRDECHLKSATAQDAPRDWRTVKLCTLYQKTCQ